MKPRHPVLFLQAFLLAGCFHSPAMVAQTSRQTDVPSKYLKGLNGAFVVFDRKANEYIRYNPQQCGRRYSPASTFKIPNSLIGLETGVIKDEHFVIPWDSVQRNRSELNRDHDLASAIANSVVWYYQELARRVGMDRMNSYIKKIGYGNNDISGGIDKFWLGNTLTISANEQVEFLRRLHTGTLPFSPRSIAIVQNILVLERTDSYVLRGKTGFADGPDSTWVGWFVGYVEKGDNVSFFAFNITTTHPEQDGARIRDERKSMALAILRDLGFL